MVLLLPALAGCATTAAVKGKSPLHEATMSADSVAVEIISVRFPLADAEANDKLWSEVDEQHFPAELRQRLTRNGFRAGVVAGPIPETLVKLMELKEKPPTPGESHQVDPASLEAEPRVMPRHLQLRAGHRSEIMASGVYDQLPLLMSETGELRGQTYPQAQGVLALKAIPRGDGRVEIELVPELHYDRPRQRWIGDQGMWRLETGKPRRAFDDMRMSALLGPGAMILLTCLPERTGSLGYYFFTTCGEPRWEQKLIVLRLCQTQHDDLVAPPPLALER